MKMNGETFGFHVGQQLVYMHGEQLTAREIQIAREAYRLAAEHYSGVAPGALAAAAAEKFPLPKVTRPRVVRDPHDVVVEWKIDESGDVGMWNGKRFVCTTQHVVRFTPARIRLWADLLANPTEEVDE